jgi:hypothetical protein
MVLSKAGSIKVNKMLGISTDTRTINYLLTGKKWENIQNQIRRNFGDMAGDVLGRIIELVLEAFNEAEEE